MNEQTKKTDAEKEDYIFEGGTGNDKKTTKEDLKRATDDPSSYEGLRSMIINPDDGEETEKDKKTGEE